MIFKLQILILSVVLYLSAGLVAADVDCSKRPERVNPKICCPIPELISDEIKEKCKAYDTTPPPPPPGMSDEATSNEANNVTQRGRKHHHHHHHNPCFASCVFNETGIYVNKTLDADKLKSYLAIVLKESAELQTAVQESFTTCAAKIEQSKGHPHPPPPPPPPSGDQNFTPPQFCPHSAGKLMGCVFKTTFKNCPKSIWNDNQECNDLREHFENCKHSHGPHGPHGPSMSPEEVTDM